MELFNNPIICAIFIGMIMSIPTFAVLIKIEKLQKLIDEQCTQFLLLTKRHSALMHEIDELSEIETYNGKNLDSLSSSVQYFINEQKTALENKIMPTPQLSEMIGVTIQEQIATEEMLMHNMRIPNSDASMKIINNVCKTYPHVDEEYITKRCLATIESQIQKAQRGGE